MCVKAHSLPFYQDTSPLLVHLVGVQKGHKFPFLDIFSGFSRSSNNKHYFATSHSSSILAIHHYIQWHTAIYWYFANFEEIGSYLQIFSSRRNVFRSFKHHAVTMETVLLPQNCLAMKLITCSGSMTCPWLGLCRFLSRFLKWRTPIWKLLMTNIQLDS